MKNRFEKIDVQFGSAPINMVFTDEKHRKEWEDQEPVIKKFIIRNLQDYAKTASTNATIMTLCNIIMDFEDRITKLEGDLEKKNE